MFRYFLSSVSVAVIMALRSWPEMSLIPVRGSRIALEPGESPVCFKMSNYRVGGPDLAFRARLPGPSGAEQGVHIRVQAYSVAVAGR